MERERKLPLLLMDPKVAPALIPTACDAAPDGSAEREGAPIETNPTFTPRRPAVGLSAIVELAETISFALLLVVDAE